MWAVGKMAGNPGVNLLSRLSTEVVSTYTYSGVPSIKTIPIGEVVSRRSDICHGVWAKSWLEEEEDWSGCETELGNISVTEVLESPKKQLTDWKVFFPSRKSKVP